MPEQSKIEWRRALKGEPSLEDVLADPIVHRLMARDGVSAEDLRRLKLQAEADTETRAA